MAIKVDPPEQAFAQTRFTNRIQELVDTLTPAELITRASMLARVPPFNATYMSIEVAAEVTRYHKAVETNDTYDAALVLRFLAYDIAHMEENLHGGSE